VPAGQLKSEVVQSVPFQYVPGGQEIGTHAEPFQLIPDEQTGCVWQIPFNK
jgi:hypothetical protein